MDRKVQAGKAFIFIFSHFGCQFSKWIETQWNSAFLHVNRWWLLSMSRYFCWNPGLVWTPKHRFLFSLNFISISRYATVFTPTIFTLFGTIVRDFSPAWFGNSGANLWVRLLSGLCRTLGPRRLGAFQRINFPRSDLRMYSLLKDQLSSHAESSTRRESPRTITPWYKMFS